MLLLTLACTWISDADVDGRLDQLDDDGDSYSIADGDCDDHNANAYPGADERWYDGVNQDCGEEQDYDADGDGYDGAADGSGEDCNDQNPEIHPDATETWYDNIDQNCDGASDFDSDLDGVDRVPEGLDCDDTQAAINPSATEVWYDNVDADCDGQDDYDADLDGQARQPEGSDCDDTDPEIYLGAEDTWYDGVNSNCDEIDEIGDYDQDQDGYYAAIFGESPSDCNDLDPQVRPGGIEDLGDARDLDCDGAGDSFAATKLELELSDTRAISASSSGSDGYVSFLAATANNASGLSLSNAAVLLEYDAEPESGPLTTRAWLSTSALDEGMDFQLISGTIVGAAGLVTATSRSLLLKRDSTASPNQWSAPAAGLSNSFNDVTMAVDSDGSVHVVGCATDGIQYMKVDLGSRAVTASDYDTTQPASDCELYMDGSGTGLLGLSDAATGEYVVLGWDTTVSTMAWVELSREPGVSLVDLDWPLESPLVELLVDSTAGQIRITDADGESTIVPTLTPIQASTDVHPSSGTRYVAWISQGGGAGFAYGDTVSGFDTATLSLPFAAKEISVLAQAEGDTVLVVVIGGDAAAQAVIVAP